jgi:hypothetical protein
MVIILRIADTTTGVQSVLVELIQVCHASQLIGARFVSELAM